MAAGPEKDEVLLQKREKKKKNRRNEKAEMGLVEAISSSGETIAREVGGNRVGLMMYDKENKRKVKKEKKVKSIEESELNIIAEKGIINGKDHIEAKKKKRKLEPNEKKNDLEFISREEKHKLKKEKGDKLKKNKSKERKKEKRDKGKGAVSSTSVEVLKDKEEGGFKETNGLRQPEKEEYENHYEKQKKQEKVKNKKMKGLEHCEKKRKTKKMNTETEELEHCEVEDINDIEELEQGVEERKKQEKKDTKKGKRRGKQDKNHTNGCSKEILFENLTSDGKALSDQKEVAYNEGRPSSSNKKRGREKDGLDDEMEKRQKNNGKKSKLVNDVEEKGVDNGNLRTKDRGGSFDHSKDFEPKKSPKKVKFSGHVEVFPSSDAADVGLEHDAPAVGLEHEEQKLVRGKRFSKKEDQMIRDAVSNYIQVHGLGENGLHMILNCGKIPEIRNCWKEISSSLPWRPARTVYWRAHNLFTRGEMGNWPEEVKAIILKFRKEKGPDWTTLAQALGRHRIHLKDMWRRLRYPNLKKGRWSQEEYQTLFDLVNLDLRMKVHEEKNTKHGMLRDNISWTAISDKLGTRASGDCCRKWYHQLTSPMVKAGGWDYTDDYRLLNELLMLDACCVEDVDWDNLIDQRSGEVCLKRWKQMCLHIGNHGLKSFAEQVEVLAKRYCPNLLEVREALDSRPVVS